jgi:hypothetical protein
VLSAEPDIVLRSSAGFMCVAYHPTEPALLAGGNFNGEVCVWNTGLQDEQLVAISPIEVRNSVGSSARLIR